MKNHSLRKMIVEAEVNLYFSKPLISMRGEESNPLRWWGENQALFPTMKRTVQKYFSAPPSSVYSERLFSEAEIIYKARRARLLPDAAKELLFLRHNLPIMNFKY